MKKIKDYLFTTLGTIGVFIFYTFSLLITLYPLLMFDMHFLLYIVLALIAQIVVNIPFGLEVLWSVGLIGAIIGTQDVFAIIYYIAYALIIGSTIIKIVKAYLYSNN